jgi:hypothetical protein
MSKSSLISCLLPSLFSATGERIVVMRKLTSEILRQNSEMGYVPHRGPDGRLSFIERDYYAELVATGKLPPGCSIQ